MAPPLDTPLVDKALKLYTIAGALMGLVLFLGGLLANVSYNTLYVAVGSTILYAALYPLTAMTPSSSKGDKAKALIVGGFAYYVILYVVWSSLYQLWIALS